MENMENCRVMDRVPGLLAVEQTKSALRGRRSSCRVMQPLEAIVLGCGAAGPSFLPPGFPFSWSSSTFSASLFSPEAIKRKQSHIFEPNHVPR